MAEDYIEISIDVFDRLGQRAKVRRSLTVERLIDEILKEFDDLNRAETEKYSLFVKGSESPLVRHQSLGALDIQPQDELVFRYAQASSRKIIQADERGFLENEQGEHIEISWQPALIGRTSNDPEHNELLLVNLDAHEWGKLVSRRHAQILYINQKYYLEPLAENNAVFLNNEELPIHHRRELKDGDLICLSRARVELVFHLEHSYKSKTVDVSTLPVQELEAILTPVLQGKPMPRARFVLPEDMGTANGVVIDHAPFLVGREGCDWLVPDTTVSRRHARIDYNPLEGKFFITDLGSSNGIRLNGSRIPVDMPAALQDGMQVLLGRQTNCYFVID